jgi:hypothetical protein
MIFSACILRAYFFLRPPFVKRKREIREIDRREREREREKPTIPKNFARKYTHRSKKVPPAYLGLFLKSTVRYRESTRYHRIYV